MEQKIVDQIKTLRMEGLSHRRVAAQLGISETSVRKYSPKEAVTRPLSAVLEEDPRFTKRQLAIAIKALENIEKNGIIPPAYWHKDAR